MNENQNDIDPDEQDPHLRRYDYSDHSGQLGFIDYYLFGQVAIVTHTEVNPALEGNGHGSRLAQAALDFFLGLGVQVVPVCGFMASRIRKFPQYIVLLTPECRRIFDI